MNLKAFRYISRVAGVITGCAVISIATASAYGATIDLTMSVTPNSASPSPGNYPGWANTFYLPYYNDNGSISVSSNTSVNFGYFITGPFVQGQTNPNVSPNFTVQITPTVSGQSPSSPLTFYGTITNPSSGVYDLNFSSSSSGPGVTGFFMGNTYAIETYAGYTFGMVSQLALNSAAGKSTNLNAFVGPTQAPEPVPAATTALAMLGLVGFVIRRKALSRH